MRIRRRPQCVSLQSSDPSTSTAATQNAAARSREGGGGDGVGRRLHQLHHHGNVDLGKKSSGVARRRLALLQQENGVDCSDSKGPGEEHGGAGDAHRSVPLPCTGGEVGSKSEPAAAVAPAVIVDVKEEKSVGNGGGGGGAKKRRGGGAPAVLMEGSRCSRVNGRGWRCSQPTLVGYALCEHHLGKGRMRSVTGGGGGRGGASQLGRTEHRPPATARNPAAAAAPPPKADEPGPNHIAHH
uniref:WRC domain-containing protein n=1 Tax=Oryza nivara TaxID=4536 RepID=A0A0E0HMJ8_ORYNI